VEVPFHDVVGELAPVRADVDRAIARVLDSGVFVGGPEVAGFERQLTSFVGAKHAIGTSSGTDALHVVFLALQIGPGDEVVTTPFTFFATAGSAARLGARIVFADIDDESLTLDPRAAETACGPRTRAVVPVNLFGALAALPAASCPIVEDAAQSIGAGPPRGIAQTLSFFPTKNLGAIGDAGAVVTDDPGLAERIALLRNHGGRPKYHHDAIGGNFRLDSIQAAILAAKLPHLSSWLERRRAIADDYRARFAASIVPAELRVPAARDVYHQFVIRTPRRDELRARLREAGIGTEVYYPEPLHLQPCFAALGYRAGSMPRAEAACRDVLALPFYPTLSPDARGYVVDQIARVFRTGSR
jgi:dTDP-4-amino-4,6-dideoxygalactose transaminase